MWEFYLNGFEKIDRDSSILSKVHFSLFGINFDACNLKQISSLKLTVISSIMMSLLSTVTAFGTCSSKCSKMKNTLSDECKLFYLCFPRCTGII